MQDFLRLMNLIDAHLLDPMVKRKQQRQERMSAWPSLESFRPIDPPLQPHAWCQNDLFVAGYPWGWSETTDLEYPIDGQPVILALRPVGSVEQPDDVAQMAVIRCCRLIAAHVEEFLDMASGIVEQRAKTLRAAPVEPFARLLNIDGAPTYLVYLDEGMVDITPVESVPAAISEAFMYHSGELILTQLMSGRGVHAAYRQVLVTLLATLRWR